MRFQVQWGRVCILELVVWGLGERIEKLGDRLGMNKVWTNKPRWFEMENQEKEIRMRELGRKHLSWKGG